MNWAEPVSRIVRPSSSPNNFIFEVFMSKNRIHKPLQIMAGSGVTMQVDTSVVT